MVTKIFDNQMQSDAVDASTGIIEFLKTDTALQKPSVRRSRGIVEARPAALS